MTSEVTDPADVEIGLHDDEPHVEGLRSRLNWLRAGVLGANDGIVSTAGVVVGVAGATTDRTTIMVAGVAALVAGALSMAAGEYVSVSTQRDSEQALLAKERRELEEEPEEELAELGIDPDELTSAWQAAWASMIAFTVGALLPLLTIVLVVADVRVPVTMGAVAVALALTGWLSAGLGYGPPGRAVLRNVGGGVFAMVVTFLVGSALGTTIA